MYTTFAFLAKAPHLTTEEFIDYYENHHVPLINRLAGPENQPLVYKRRYTHRDDPAHIIVKASVDADGRPMATANLDSFTPSPASLGSSGGDPGNIDFDVVTEIGFEDKGGMERWMASVSTGENGKAVAADEGRFLLRGRTRAVVVEERISFG